MADPGPRLTLEAAQSIQPSAHGFTLMSIKALHHLGVVELQFKAQGERDNPATGETVNFKIKLKTEKSPRGSVDPQRQADALDVPQLPKLRFQHSRYYMGLLRERKEETVGGVEAHRLGRPAPG